MAVCAVFLQPLDAGAGDARDRRFIAGHHLFHAARLAVDYFPVRGFVCRTRRAGQPHLTCGVGKPPACSATRPIEGASGRDYRSPENDRVRLSCR